MSAEDGHLPAAGDVDHSRATEGVCDPTQDHPATPAPVFASHASTAMVVWT